MSFNKLCKIILGLIICLSCNQTLIYDLIIKEGEVYDGTGSEGVIIDIAIKDDFIVKIGYLDNAKAKRVINAKGLVVAPGFIDVHTHLEPLMRL